MIIMDKIKVLVVPSNRNWSGQHRSIKPHLDLEKKYPEEYFVDIDFNPDLDDEDYLKQYDIVHYHNKLGSFASTNANVEKLVGLGIIPVMDVDEYWLPHEKHPSHKLFKSQNMDKLILDNIKGAKHILTTNWGLRDEIKKYNENVEVILTTFDLDDKTLKLPTVESDRLKIGWVGDPNSLADLKPLKGFVSKLRSDGLLDKVQFVLTGFDLSDRRPFFNKETGQMDSRPLLPIETVWYQYEKIFTEGYTTVSPEYKKHLITFENKEYEGDMNNEPYRRLWKKQDQLSYYQYFDMVMMPLLDNTYNRCKCSASEVIALSYQIKKPIIAQNVGLFEVFNNVFEKGGVLNKDGDGFLIQPDKKSKDWYKAIKKIIQNPELVDVVKNNLQEYLGEKSMRDETIDDLNNFYKGLLVSDKCNSFV